MKLEDIMKLWEEDCEIDRTELGEEALKIPKLHSKYYRIFMQEKVLLERYKSDLKVLKLRKHEFYTQGPSKEDLEEGWKLPAIGKIIRQDVQQYIDADKHVIELTLKIGLQNEKVAFLEDIIKSITNRNFIIRSAIDWSKFKSGA